MRSEEQRSRLEALNRGHLTETVPQDPPTDAAPRLPKGARLPAAAQADDVWAVVGSSLSDVLPGAERSTDGFVCFEASRPLSAGIPWVDALDAPYRAALAGEGLRGRLGMSHTIDSGRVAFLDIETLGLRGEQVFLIGSAGIGADGVLQCRQIIARTPGEEAAMLRAWLSDLSLLDLLVTFNGRDFDIPALWGRLERHGCTAELPHHVDVLLEARRRYWGKLPNCRLLTLESLVCGRRRDGDVPGHLIPGVYQAYVRTGDAAGLAQIAHHNALDLATTLELFVRFWGS